MRTILFQTALLIPGRQAECPCCARRHRPIDPELQQRLPAPDAATANRAPAGCKRVANTGIQQSGIMRAFSDFMGHQDRVRRRTT